MGTTKPRRSLRTAATAGSGAAGGAAGWCGGLILEQRFQACHESKEKEVQIMPCCANSIWPCKSKGKFYVHYSLKW